MAVIRAVWTVLLAVALIIAAIVVVGWLFELVYGVVTAFSHLLDIINEGGHRG